MPTTTPAPAPFTCRLGHAGCAEVTPQEDNIERGLLHLARRCDGAQQHDSVGFNGFHTELGHELATAAVGQHLGFARRLTAFNVVKTYKNTQLAAAGIEVPDIYEPRQIVGGSRPKPAAPNGKSSRPPIAGAGEISVRGEITKVRAQKSEWMAGEVAFSESGQRRVVNFSGVIVGGKVGSSVELVGTIIHDPKWGDQFKIRDGRTIGVVESGESGVTPPQRHDVIQVEGVVAKVLWEPKDNGFAGLLLDSPSGTRFVAKGTIRFVSEGQSLILSGKWVPSQRTPGQNDFSFDSASVKPERTQSGLARWLVGLQVPGVAEGTADKIVMSLVHDHKMKADQVWDVLQKNPDIVLDCKGVPKAKLELVAGKVREILTDGLAENSARSQLLSWGLTPSQAQKAIEAYGPLRVIEVVKANPYAALARNKAIRGVGFKIVDTQIAPHLGITSDNPFRIQAGCEYALEEAEGRGNVFLPMAVLLEKAGQVLGGAATAEALEGAIAALAAERVVVKDEQRIYLQRLYRAETDFARLIHQRVRSGRKLDPVRPSELAQFEKATGVKLSEEQVAAVDLCVRHPVCILTGGAGRGKTMIVKAIIWILSARKQQCVLAAPTGRASRIMASACGHEASTIHRLIGMRSDEEAASGSAEVFDGKHALVLDETSMLDQPLAAAVVRKMPRDLKLIMVGDPNQLPSVGPGRVLNNLIDSGVVPVARLTKVFRQAAESEIIRAADMMLEGLCPEPTAYQVGVFRPGQFGFVEVDKDQVSQIVCDLYAEALQAGIPHEDILVISPTKGAGTEGDPGVRGLNLILQSRFNPTGEPILRNSTLRVGDRVLQTSNDYELGVRNGDVGTIVRVNKTEGQGPKGVVVRMDYGLTVVYPFNGLASLELGYAVTVHKSQGSQAAITIQVYLPHYLLNRRELLYTGLTRGKNTAIGVGSMKAMADGVRNTSRDERSTYLMERLRQLAATANTTPADEAVTEDEDAEDLDD